MFQMTVKVFEFDHDLQSNVYPKWREFLVSMFYSGMHQEQKTPFVFGEKVLEDIDLVK